MKQPVSCGFIGLGLIGGSIAKALKANLENITIYAWDTNAEALSLAEKEGIVDVPLMQIGPDFKQCGVIFLCAPVSCNDENLERIREFLSAGCILTDVGSVKSGIHKQVQVLGLEKSFIGGHPMAGSERFGYVNSKEKLLENAYYILTPTEQTPPEKLEFLKELISHTGAIPLILSNEEHDFVTAAVSHLPHVAASSLVHLVKEADSSEGVMKMIAAGGFKDITRIASSSPVMWQQICLHNAENLSALLGSYIYTLCKIKDRIDAGAGQDIYDFFDDARAYRDSFIDASSGPIKKVYSVNIDIADEPGALASIATMLALNGINIKNIGIVHNREQEAGVLRIEFYAENDMTHAAVLLKNRGYDVHEKN